MPTQMMEVWDRSADGCHLLLYRFNRPVVKVMVAKDEV